MPADPLPDRNLSLLWHNLRRGADLVGLLRRFRRRRQTCGELLLQPVQVPIPKLMLYQSDTGHSEYVPIFIPLFCNLFC